jgi:hypothetical protein
MTQNNMVIHSFKNIIQDGMNNWPNLDILTNNLKNCVSQQKQFVLKKLFV